MWRAAALLALLVGCTGSDTSNKKPEPPFSLALDSAEPVELLHGSERGFAVRLGRADGFTSPVALRAEVSPADDGVEARIIEEKMTKAVVKVSETARPGDYVLRVVGQSANDAEASAELRLRIPPKD